MEYSSIIIALMAAGVVFLGLICMALWRIAGNLNFGETRQSAEAYAPAAAMPARTAPAPAALSPELIAAISAAIAEDLGTDITGIRITSVKKL